MAMRTQRLEYHPYAEREPNAVPSDVTPSPRPSPEAQHGGPHAGGRQAHAPARRAVRLPRPASPQASDSAPHGHPHPDLRVALRSRGLTPAGGIDALRRASPAPPAWSRRPGSAGAPLALLGLATPKTEESCWVPLTQHTATPPHSRPRARPPGCAHRAADGVPPGCGGGADPQRRACGRNWRPYAVRVRGPGGGVPPQRPVRGRRHQQLRPDGGPGAWRGAARSVLGCWPCPVGTGDSQLLR